MAEKILVTGAAGLLGSHLTRLLVKNGRSVRAIRRPTSRMDLVHDIENQVEWMEADVADLLSLEPVFEGVSHVFHAAAIVSFDPRDREKMTRTNVEGTANVVNLCLDFGVKKLVHVSSVAAIGRVAGKNEVAETNRWERSAANSQYAITKFQAEQEAWRGLAEGLDVAVVNPSIIVGAGFWNEGSTRFFRQIDRGLRFCPPGGSGFVDVRDVARFMMLLMDSDVIGERFILNGDNCSYRQFFGLIATALKRKPPSFPVNKWMAELAWMFGWLQQKLTGRPPMVTRETARNAMQTWVYRNEKSLQLADFKYVGLEKTIREVAEIYLKNKGRPGVLPV